MHAWAIACCTLCVLVTAHAASIVSVPFFDPVGSILDAGRESTEFSSANAAFLCDLTGSGSLDVLLCWGNYLLWSRNEGGGLFAPSIAVHAGPCNAVVCADVDGDGANDPVVVLANGNVVWFKNTADSESHFSSALPILDPSNVSLDIALAPLTNASALDFVGATASGVVIAPHSPWGGFQAPFMLPSNGIQGSKSHPPLVATARMFGHPVIANAGVLSASFAIGLYVRLRNGSFAHGPTLPLLSVEILDLFFHDVDADGCPDIVLASLVAVRLFYCIQPVVACALAMLDGRTTPQSCNASVAAAPWFTVGVERTGGGATATMADINNDGLLDVVVLQYSPSNWLMLLNQGNRSFARSTQEVSQDFPSQLLAGDLNGDHALDLVLVDFQTRWFRNTLPSTTNPLAHYKRAGHELYMQPDASVSCIVACDLSNDGELDIVVSRLGGLTWFRRVVDVNGSHQEFVQQAVLVDKYTPIDLSCVDVDQDGLLDVVLTNQDANNIVMYRNQWFLGNVSAGNLSSPMVLASFPGPEHIVWADFDLDGYPDMAVTSFQVGASFWLSSGSAGGALPTFNTRQHLGANVSALFAKDLDQDGRVDLCTTSLQGAVKFFRNTPTPNGVAFVGRTIGLAQALSLIADDLDLDGRPEVIVASLSGIVVFPNMGAGVFAPQVHLDMPLSSSIIQSIATGDTTQSGRPDIIYRTRDGVVHVLLNQGSVFSAPQQVSGSFKDLQGLVPLSIAPLDCHHRGSSVCALEILISSATGVLRLQRRGILELTVEVEDWANPPLSWPASGPALFTGGTALWPTVNLNTLLPPPSVVTLTRRSTAPLILRRPWTMAPFPFNPGAQQPFIVQLPQHGLTVHCCLLSSADTSCVHFTVHTIVRVTGLPLTVLPCPEASATHGLRAVRISGLGTSLLFSPFCRRGGRTVSCQGTSSPEPAAPLVAGTSVHAVPASFPGSRVVRIPGSGAVLVVSGFSSRVAGAALVVDESRWRVYGGHWPLVTFVNCSTKALGGAMHVSHSEVQAKGLLIQHCRSVGVGGAIAALDSTLKFSNSVFRSNRAASGGAIASSNGPLVLANVSFDANIASSCGGGVQLIASGVAALSWTHVTGRSNQAYSGGLLCLQSAVVSVDGLEAHENIASNDGGAASCMSGCSLKVTNAQIARNRAFSNGGAMSAFEARIEIGHAAFSDNVALSGDGGAIHVGFTTLDIQHSNFTRNRAQGTGGAVNCAGSPDLFASLSLDRAKLLHNVGVQGGAIGSNECGLSLSSSLISNNTAIRSTAADTLRTNAPNGGGGGLSFLTIVSAQLTLFAVNVTRCTAATSGGGVWVSAPPSSMDISSTRVTHNRAVEGGGGGILALGYPPLLSANVVVRNNSALYSPDVGTAVEQLGVVEDTVSTRVQLSSVVFAGSLILALKDRFGAVVLSDSVSLLTLETRDPAVTVASSSVLVGVQARRGLFNLTRQFAVVASEPNTTHQLSWSLQVLSTPSLTRYGTSTGPLTPVQLPPALNITIGLCAPGSYWLASAKRCLLCAPGTYSAAHGSRVCLDCEPGTYRGTPGGWECHSCPRLLYAEQRRATSCSSCSINTFWRNTSVACGPCLPTQVASGGVCICPVSTVQWHENGHLSCKSCGEIQGAYCSSNATNLEPAQLQAQAGYWHDPNDARRFLPCPFPQSCQRAGCQAFSEGPCCVRCSMGSFRSFTGQCTVCPKGSVLVTVLVLLAFALVVAMLVAVYMNYSDLGLAEQTVVPDVADAKSADNNGDFDEWLGDVSPTINSRPHKNMTSASRRKKLLSLFKLVVGHFQILTLLVLAGGASSAGSNNSSSSGFPSQLKQFAAYTGLAILRVLQLVPLPCAMSPDNAFVLTTIASLLTPVFLALLVGCGSLMLEMCARVRQKTSAPAKQQRAVQAFCVLVFVAFPTITAELLQVFFHQRCGAYLDVVGGNGSMTASGVSFRIAQLLSAVGLPLYCVGIPVAFILLLRRNVHAKGSAAQQSPFAFLYQDLKAHRWWFSSVSLTEKTLFAAVAVFWADRPSAQLCLASLLTVATILVLALSKPYFGWQQVFILFSRVVIFLTLFGAVALRLQHVQTANCQTSGGDCSGGGFLDAAITTAFLLLLNVAVLLVALALLVYWVSESQRPKGARSSSTLTTLRTPLVQQAHVELSPAGPAPDL